MTTPECPYHHESHEGDGCMWWTVRCEGSPEILGVEAAVERLNKQAAEIERLREENARLRETMRWRSVEEELPPTNDPVLVYSPHYIWQRTAAYWTKYGWQNEEYGIDPPTHWQPLPEPPQ